VKYILVTGVSSGIGYDIIKYFLSLEYYVFGSVRKDEDKERLEKEFTSNFKALVFDVTDFKAVESSLSEVKEIIKENSLTALVNNAGYAQSGPMALLSDEEFRMQMEVNLFGVRNVINTFLPLLGASKDFKGKAGKIINISSISGVFNTPMNGAYCVAKHALESLAEVYRRELMMYKIQVVSIQPGPIESDLWKKNIGSLSKYYDSDYSIMAKNTDKIMIDAKKDALSPRVISELVHKIIVKKSPKLSYIVNKNRLSSIVMVKYIPTRVIDYLLNYVLNKDR
jgi:NAD(P)-dependent dehydrogenase (short-subunit alcohol dehydrogenase family)